MSDINGLKKPEEVTREFHLMVENPDIVRSFLNVDPAGDDDEELSQQRIEQHLNGFDEENRGSGS